MPATDHLRLVDHHCHGVIDHQPDGEEFRILEEVTPGSTPATFASRFSAALREASAGAVGFKSIIAYRYGLDVDDEPPAAADVRSAFAEWQRSSEHEQRYRITSPVLMQHILWEAIYDLARP